MSRMSLLGCHIDLEELISSDHLYIICHTYLHVLCIGTCIIYYICEESEGNACMVVFVLDFNWLAT